MFTLNSSLNQIQSSELSNFINNADFTTFFAKRKLSTGWYSDLSQMHFRLSEIQRKFFEEASRVKDGFKILMLN